MSDSSTTANALHVVCPQCLAVNRFAAVRLADTPKCGKCHGALFDGHPIELSASTFDKQLGRNDIPLVVDFWAPWCGPCKMMAPEFERAAAELEPHYRLAKLNTEAEPELGARFGVRSIPTLIAFRNGKEVARQPGAMRAPDIVRWTKAQL